MFRGKESSNRIELSRLVQDLLNFGVLGSLQLWGWGWMDGGGGWLGGASHTCAHACACTHPHARTHTHVKHDNFMQMAVPIGGTLGIPYDVIHVCACMHCMHAHACACVWGAPSHHPHPHPPTPWGGPPESVKIQ